MKKSKNLFLDNLGRVSCSMNLFSRFVIAVSLIMASSAGIAGAIDCKRSIKRIFTGYTDSASKIFIEYSDGHSGAAMRLPFVNNDEEVVNRTLSVLLAGHMAGKTIYSRYISGLDGSEPSCTPTTNQALIAVWIE